MANYGKAACAARNRESNDTEDFEEFIDLLSEKVLTALRISIPDEALRAIVLADAFAKCYAEDLYTGEGIDEIEDAKDIVGELVAEHIIDNDPMVCFDFESCIDDDEPDNLFDEEGSCDCSLCGGDCCTCPYNDTVPRYVYENGMVRRFDSGRDLDA